MSYVIHRGESFVLAGEVFFPAGSTKTLSDYELIVMISTTETGKTIKAYTETDRTGVHIERREWNRYTIACTGEHTKKLSIGNITISLAFVDKITGEKQLAEESIDIRIEPTRFNDNDL